jgi:hypothetical protein
MPHSLRRLDRRRLLVIAGVAIAIAAPSFLHAQRAVDRTRARMHPTGVEPRARGLAVLVTRRRAGRVEGKLELALRRLQRATDYDVILGDLRIGSFTTRRAGTARVRFRTQPRRGEQLLGSDPRGHLLLVRDAAGRDVLAGRMPGEAPAEPTVRCCLADTGCTEVPAAECAARGGNDLGAGSCLPDPCTPPPLPEPPVTCCLGGAAAARCEQLAPSACAAQAGTALTVASCTPDPCQPAQPPEDEEDIRCCVPDGFGEFDCEELTLTDCLEEEPGSTPHGPGDCFDDNPCGPDEF